MNNKKITSRETELPDIIAEFDEIIATLRKHAFGRPRRSLDWAIRESQNAISELKMYSLSKNTKSGRDERIASEIVSVAKELLTIAKKKGEVPEAFKKQWKKNDKGKKDDSDDKGDKKKDDGKMPKELLDKFKKKKKSSELLTAVKYVEIDNLDFSQKAAAIVWMDPSIQGKAGAQKAKRSGLKINGFGTGRKGSFITYTSGDPKKFISWLKNKGIDVRIEKDNHAAQRAINA